METVSAPVSENSAVTVVVSGPAEVPVGGDMGGCVSKQKEGGYDVETADQAPKDKGKGKKEPAGGLKTNIDKWYQDLLNKTVETAPERALKFGIIVTYPEPTVLAVYPADFVPDEKGVKDIIAALHKNDTKEIAEHGLYLGKGCANGTPGKMDAGKAIYGTDGKEGGTDAFVAEKSLLLGCYVAKPAATTRLLRKTAQYMEEQHK